MNLKRNNLFNLKLYLLLTSFFILFTAFGTILHEFGHYFVAKQLGFLPEFHYNKVNHNNTPVLEYLSEITKEHLYELKNNIDFPEKENYIKISNKYSYENFLITLAGPIQTLLTGTFSFILFLIYKRKLFIKKSVSYLGWILILFSLFWLRQIFNTITSLYFYLKFDKFPTQSDEAKINNYLNLPDFTTEFITSLIGIIILLVILKSIPRNTILTFLLSGITGGLLGFYLWFYEIGILLFP